MTGKDLSRRTALTTAAGIGIVAGLNPSAVRARQQLDFGDPKDSLHAVVKLRGDIAGGRVLQWYSGVLTLLVAGEKPAPVCSYQGVIRTDWTPRRDGSFGYRTFDLGYFGDLETGHYVDSLTNPVTGKTVRPTLIEDGPIERIYSERGIYSEDRGAPGADQSLDIPWKIAGDHVWYGADFVFEYDNPLPPADYPDLSSTDKVAQRSQFTYRGRLSDLENETISRAPGETILLVTSTIHPWHEMGRYSGFQQIQTVSQKIESDADIPDHYKEFMSETRPDFLTANTPFVGAGNSFLKYKRDRLGLAP